MNEWMYDVGETPVRSCGRLDSVTPSSAPLSCASLYRVSSRLVHIVCRYQGILANLASIHYVGYKVSTVSVYVLCLIVNIL